jgi:hypothetical protein
VRKSPSRGQSISNLSIQVVDRERLAEPEVFELCWIAMRAQYFLIEAIHGADSTLGGFQHRCACAGLRSSGRRANLCDT